MKQLFTSKIVSVLALLPLISFASPLVAQQAITGSIADGSLHEFDVYSLEAREQLQSQLNKQAQEM